MSDYPEHDKLRAIQHESQAVGEFLDWASEKHGAQLSRVPEGYTDTLMPLGIPTRTLLAEFFEIDEAKIEAEKRAMLASLREEL